MSGSAVNKWHVQSAAANTMEMQQSSFHPELAGFTTQVALISQFGECY